eukprot:TRINITY_DN26415_c0_g1_i1.p1 TRINITY_DN26415_c0_g1~~TRINITY_DN26415_c0_g1_i1.p1  ORF type:complete len:252 (-),score=45.46 TRINITY_DN26415_c0_g1_i1:65-820(-)
MYEPAMQRLQCLAGHLVPVSCAAGGHKSPPANRLEGKIAIVTGAASGIGRAASLAFAEQGACVYCVDWDQAGTDDTAAAIIRTGGRAKAAQFDVSTEEANRKMVANCIAEFGGLHVFFANAGVSGSPKAFWDLSAEDWERTLRINTIGVAMGFKYAAQHMRQNGVDNGSLIATASVAGIRSGAGTTDYSASKSAVISIVQTCANQLAGTGIRCNAICPGLIETGMTKPMYDSARQHGKEDAPIHKKTHAEF